MSAVVSAQEIEPRAYANAPVGLNQLALGYAWSNGNVLLDPALPIEDLDAEIQLVFLRYVHTFEFFGDSAKFKALLPWSSGDWVGSLNDEPGQRQDQGMGDAWLALEWNFRGAPALELSEFARQPRRTSMSASVLVTVPVGSYDADRLLNLGSNRWSVRAELAAARTLGPWALEGVVGVRWFTKNDNFFGGLTLEQQPLWFVKTHLIYSLPRAGTWFAVGAGYGQGGRTQIDGEYKETTQKNWRFSAVVAYPIDARNGLSLTLGSGITSGAGSDFDSVALAYQHAWGGGL